MLFRRACLVVIVASSAVVGRAGCSHPLEAGGPSARVTGIRRGSALTVRPPVSVRTTEPPPDVRGALEALSRALRVLFPPTTVDDYHAWPDWPQWHRLGLCEQPRSDRPDGIWWDRPGKYPGGLGILATSSASVGGSTRLDLASPAEQIRVGRRIRDRYGWGAWACARGFGW